MSSSCTTGARPNPPRRTGILLAAFVAATISLLGFGAQAADDKDAKVLSKEDKTCLECHAKAGFEKTLGNGEKLSLSISPRRFADSAHNSSGCDGCHSEIDLKDHGKAPKAIASKREHALGMMETCRDCHKKTVRLYEDSVHAALVQGGSEKAPLCSDCHNPHATPLAKEAAGHADPVQCHQCHEKIAGALKQSVHGHSEDEALVCKDCHRTHNVKAASLGENMKAQCLSCHRDAASTHAKWLPNTERHLEAISCAACHSPDAKRRVNLRLYDGASHQQASEKVGVPQFKKIAHVADDKEIGLDGRALGVCCRSSTAVAPTRRWCCAAGSKCKPASKRIGWVPRRWQPRTATPATAPVPSRSRASACRWPGPTAGRCVTMRARAC